MTALAEYLLKANLCLVGFYALYYVLLRRHTFFRLNRAYLLTAMGLSFVLPLISLPEPVVATVALPLINLPVTAVAAQPTGPTPEEVLLVVYGVGALVFLSLLLVSLWRLRQLICRGEATRQSDHTLVLMPDDQVAPFSFFRFLVLNTTDFTQHADPILRHELAHIRQWHSVDVLLAELIKVVCWPNPVAWLYKRSLQQVHEYLADQEAADKAQYARFLFDYAFQTEPDLMVNSFFTPAFLTQRIRMLYQSPNTSRVLWKYALVLPLLAVLVGLTAAREPIELIIQRDILPGDTGQIRSGFVYGPDSKPLSGAHVIVRNTNQGTETDAKGYFKLAAVPDAASLVISFVGYETVDIPVGSRHKFAVTLVTETTKLPEVVVDESPKPVRPAETSQPISTTTSPNEIFTVVEQSPEFPGGMVALGQYIGANLRYPDAARQQHIEGTVFVNFVVTTEGSITDVMILKGIGYGCDGESVRLVQGMPRWKPGRQRGRPVNVKFNLPIKFVLGADKPSDNTTSLQNVAAPRSTTYTSITMSGGGSTGEKPLIIVDGLERKDFDLNSITPDNIQSINVLKGAAAQGTYGEKGKNGVIEVTTKTKKP